MIFEEYRKLAEIANREYARIVLEAKIQYLPSGIPQKLRIYLIDETVLDVWLSEKGKYSYHWEQRPKRNYIYRHDNSEHQKWRNIATFPKHFHDGKEINVKPSFISNSPPEAIRDFLRFVQDKMTKEIKRD